MKNKKILITLFAALTLSGLLYPNFAHDLTNRTLGYGVNLLIAMLLLAFSKQQLMPALFTPFTLYQKIKRISKT